MKKSLIASMMLACHLWLSGTAQNFEDIQSPKIIPPSPDAAALGKYGQYPVDHSTGIPSISIPLYEIKTPRLSLPISLSYHASGIKVDETAAWTGLGWSLNAGGVVTRTVMGLPDEWGQGILSYPLLHASDIQWPRDSLYLANMSHGDQDGQPDQFFYNFNEYAGAFSFLTDGTPILTPYKALKVKFSTAGGFIILDEQGNKYTFNSTESVQSSGSLYLAAITSSWYVSSIVSADLSDTILFNYTTDASTQSEYAYNFTQNVGPKANNSESAPLAYGAHLWPLSESSTLRTYQPIRISNITFKGGKVDFIRKSGRLDNPGYSLDSIIISSMMPSGQYTRLKSFKLQTGYFTSTLTNAGPYLPSSGPTFYRLILTGLQEIDQNNAVTKTHKFDYNQTMLPPVHNFGQDQWGYYNGHYDNQSLMQSQQIVADDQGTVFTIGDAQGADRSVSTTYAQAGMLQKITYPTKGFTLLNFESNRSDQPATVTGGVSAGAVGYYQPSSIQYYTPTTYNLQSGGMVFHIHIRKAGDIPYTLPVNPYIEVVAAASGNILYTAVAQSANDVDVTVSLPVQAGVQYKLHAVAQGGDMNSVTSLLPTATISTSFLINTTSLAPVGGVRIANIQQFDSDSILLSTKTYTYGPDESGGGSLLSGSLMTNNVTHAAYIVPTGDGSYCHLSTCLGAAINQSLQTFYSNSMYALSTVNGAPVGYGTVTEYEGDLVHNNGKTTYSYINNSDSILLCPSAYMAGVKPIPVAWKNVGPIREASYRHTGNGVYAIEQEKLTSYSLVTKPAARGLIVGYTFVTPWDQSAWEFHPIANYYWFDYPISSGAAVPAQTIVNNYDSTGTAILLADTTNYYYDNPTLLQPTRVVRADSKGYALTTYTYRPLDKSAINDLTPLSTTASQALDSMVARNIITPVIQQSQYRNSNLVQLSLTNYKNWDSRIIAPQTVQVQLAANPLETRLQFNRYDASGNLLELQKTGGVKEVYFWGYRGLYPVAKVQNTTYDNAATYITQGILDNPSADAALRTQLNNLRGIPGTLVNTFTYKPLTGITSQTDPQGRTTFYEYDAFSRLKDLKDKDGNIIKTFEYHYK